MRFKKFATEISWNAFHNGFTRDFVFNEVDFLEISLHLKMNHFSTICKIISSHLLA